MEEEEMLDLGEEHSGSEGSNRSQNNEALE